MPTSKPRVPNNPSNREILVELRQFQGDLNTMSQNVQTLMDWKRGLEIADNAVDAYKRKEESERMNKSKLKVNSLLADIMSRYVIPILIALTAIIYIIEARQR